MASLCLPACNHLNHSKRTAAEAQAEDNSTAQWVMLPMEGFYEFQAIGDLGNDLNLGRKTHTVKKSTTNESSRQEVPNTARANTIKVSDNLVVAAEFKDSRLRPAVLAKLRVSKDKGLTDQVREELRSLFRRPENQAITDMDLTGLSDASKSALLNMKDQDVFIEGTTQAFDRRIAIFDSEIKHISGQRGVKTQELLAAIRAKNEFIVTFITTFPLLRVENISDAARAEETQLRTTVVEKGVAIDHAIETQNAEEQNALELERLKIVSDFLQRYADDETKINWFRARVGIIQSDLDASRRDDTERKLDQPSQRSVALAERVNLIHGYFIRYENSELQPQFAPKKSYALAAIRFPLLPCSRSPMKLARHPSA